MQFRYLKSFKKHRLNHALEKLHGKSGEGRVGVGEEAKSVDNSSDQVSSSNETIVLEGKDEGVVVKKEESINDETGKWFPLLQVSVMLN